MTARYAEIAEEIKRAAAVRAGETHNLVVLGRRSGLSKEALNEVIDEARTGYDLLVEGYQIILGMSMGAQA